MIWRVSFWAMGSEEWRDRLVNALAEQGWPSHHEGPDDGWWKIITDLEAGSGDEAVSSVYGVATGFDPLPPGADDFWIDPAFSTLALGGTWTSSGDADDFTIST